jgi:hypothetical protein
LTDYLNVLDAERQEFDLEEQYVGTEQTAAEHLIALYKALGGGWERHELIPAIKQPEPAIIAAARRLLAPDSSADGRAVHGQVPPLLVQPPGTD